ncbi:MAG: hypothetical protein GY702_01050 [Desulfobulbaceae bacterium]|nr:hypothetical protein [Desulfobulbaceae bacterium]
MKRKIIIPIVIVLFLILLGAGYLGYSFIKEGTTSKDYQHDADIVRLNDILLFSKYIDEFKSKTGRFPLQGVSDLPNYVNIATADQKQYIKGSPPNDHVVSELEILIDDLKTVLGNSIETPFDPQKVPVNKPNHYIYMIKGNTFYFAVHLHNSYGFTRNIGKYYNKLEISNTHNPKSGIWNYNVISTNQEFINACSTSLHKLGYFKNLRKSQNQ